MSDNQATPMNPNSPTPLYLQIKEYCQDSITSGDYPEHTRLPSERRLAERFQVSRMTVTKALKGLEQEGWLYTRMGKGTFVASRTKIDQKLESLMSFTEDMKTQHRQVTSQVLYAGVEACAGEVAAELRLATGTPVFVLERLRLADGEIIALERTHIPNLLCPGIEQAHDFSKESLYGVLRGKYALQLTEAQQTVEARRPAPDEMDKLHTGPATPVLGFTRTTFTPQGQPIEFVRSVYLGNRYKLRISLKPTSSNMQHQGA